MIIRILLIVLLGSVSWAADNDVFRVHGEIVYRINTKGALWGTNEVSVEMRHRGSAFLIEHGDTSLVVTAAHVVVDTWPILELTSGGVVYKIGKGTEITSATVRLRIGDLAEVPQKLVIDYTRDIAFISLSFEAIARLNANTIRPFAAPPERELKVKALGFPGTTSPQISPEYTVTSTVGEFLSLSGSLGPGYSGGPVLAMNKCLGLISRDDGKQARVIPISSIQAVLDIFDKQAIDYQDGMKVDELVTGRR